MNLDWQIAASVFECIQTLRIKTPTGYPAWSAIPYETSSGREASFNRFGVDSVADE
jgi:hypothetical protein